MWAEILKDLTEEQFVKGLTVFCRDHCEIYPGTNVPALIRKYGFDLKEIDIKTEAMLVFYGRATEYDRDAANEAEGIVDRASTGLVADKKWDEKRFIDLYVGLATQNRSVRHEAKKLS